MTTNKKSIDDYLEERLEGWAEWLRGDNFVGIGYPNQSTLELIRQGRFLRKTVLAFQSFKLTKMRKKWRNIFAKFRSISPSWRRR